MPGELKTCTIKREGNGPHYRWKAYLTYVFEEKTSVFIEDERDPVGIDLGLDNVVVASEYTEFPNSRHLLKAESKVARIQRKMSSFEKDSEGWIKCKQSLYHAFIRLKNVRRAERYEIVNWIVRNFNNIGMEDLEIQKLLDKSLGKGMRKSYRDASWRMLLDALCTKAAEAGCIVVKVNPAYSSQLCSQCGRLVPKDLSVRRHVCICGLDTGRDRNGALNVLRWSLPAMHLKECEMERFL